MHTPLDNGHSYLHFSEYPVFHRFTKKVSYLRYGEAEEVDWDVSERLGAAALLSLTEVPCLTKALCSLESWSLSEALEAQ